MFVPEQKVPKHFSVSQCNFQRFRESERPIAKQNKLLAVDWQQDHGQTWPFTCKKTLNVGKKQPTGDFWR
jgi:hypothetical protein